MFCCWFNWFLCKLKWQRKFVKSVSCFRFATHHRTHVKYQTTQLENVGLFVDALPAVFITYNILRERNLPLTQLSSFFLHAVSVQHNCYWYSFCAHPSSRTVRQEGNVRICACLFAFVPHCLFRIFQVSNKISTQSFAKIQRRQTLNAC